MMAGLDAFATRAVSALINGGYQGLLITILVALGFRCLSRTNAATRHTVALATLILVAVLPLLHFLASAADAAGIEPASPAVTIPDKPGRTPAPNVSAPDPGAVLATVPGPLRRWAPVRARTSSPAGASAGRAGLPGETGFAKAVAVEPVESPVARGTEAQPLRAVVPASSSAPAASHGSEAAQPASSDPPGGRSPTVGQLLSEARLELEAICPTGIAGWVLAVWLGLAMLRLGSLARECYQLRRLALAGRPAPDALNERFGALASSLGRGRRTRLLVTPRIASPLAAGFLDPVVLLPAGLSSSTPLERLEPVLRHELAHVRRRDVWSNLVQQIVRAIFFYHPAVWWLSRRLTVDREIACDDFVLAATVAPRDYALLLTEFAGRLSGRRLSTALSGWSHPSQLKERIHMILNPRRNASPALAKKRAGLLAATTAVVSLITWQAGPRLALAADTAADQPGGHRSTGEAARSLVSEQRAAVVVPSTGDREIAAGATSPSATGSPAALPAYVARSSGVNAQPESRRRSSATAGRGAASSAPARTASPAPDAPVAAVDEASAVSSNPTEVPSSDSTRAGDVSLEGRLERLERLVETLLTDDGFERAKPGAADDPFGTIRGEPGRLADLAPPPESTRADRSLDPIQAETSLELGIAFGADDLARGRLDKMKELEIALREKGITLKEGDMARVAELARRTAAATARESARHAAAAGGYGFGGELFAGPYGHAPSLDEQRQALEDQQQALQRQMERLGQQLHAVAAQIEQIERQRSALQELEEPGHPEPLVMPDLEDLWESAPEDEPVSPPRPRQIF